MAKTVVRRDIQVLRAVAVLLVMFSHSGVPGFAGGYVGVDVFFVISGFLITGILAREVRRDGRISILDFYARRARRILPVASVVLVAITAASWLAFGYIRAAQVLHDVVWAALFGANINAARSGADYFATDSFLSPVQHFWSLAVEEQFYLVWPAVIGLIVLVGRRRDNRHLAVALGVVCAVSLAWSVHRTGLSPSSAYFSTLTRAWELGAGALLALATARFRGVRRPVLGVASWVGLGLVVFATVSFTDATAFPGSAALVPVLGAVLLLVGGMGPTPAGATYVLDRRPLRWVGDISYSLYLWHWPFLTIPAMAAGRQLSVQENLLLLLGALAASALTHRCVEKPFRQASFLRPSIKAVALWPAAVATVLAGVAVVGTQLPSASGSVPTVRLDAMQHPARTKIVEAVQHAAGLARAGAPIPAALTPSPLALRADNWQLPAACWAALGETSSRICPMGDTATARTIVLFGDSHMGMWTAPIADQARTRGWKVVPLVKAGCPPVEVTMWRADRRARFTECDSWRRWAYAEIARLSPDRVILTGFTQQPFLDPHTGGQMAEGKVAAATAAGLRSSMTRLMADGGQLSVIGDTTLLPAYAADCLGGRKSTLATCAKPVEPVTASRNNIWRQVASQQGADYVDVSPWLCADGVCPLVVGNVVVYTDRHHLTRTYAATLGAVLSDALRL